MICTDVRETKPSTGQCNVYTRTGIKQKLVILWHSQMFLPCSFYSKIYFGFRSNGTSINKRMNYNWDFSQITCSTLYLVILSIVKVSPEQAECIIIMTSITAFIFPSNNSIYTNLWDFDNVPLLHGDYIRPHFPLHQYEWMQVFFAHNIKGSTWMLQYVMLVFTDTPGKSSDKTKARRVGCHKTPTLSLSGHE